MLGRNPESFAPENAAYSATSSDVLTTPTPPTIPVALNRGTPPGLTAEGWLSFVSALPVIMPRPKVVPSIEREGFNACPGRKFVLRVQPRLVFSIPYKSAFGVFVTPGGK